MFADILFTPAFRAKRLLGCVSNTDLESTRNRKNATGANFYYYIGLSSCVLFFVSNHGGLQPTSDVLNLLVMASNLLAMASKLIAMDPTQ